MTINVSVDFAFAILCVAVAIGAALAIRYLYRPSLRAPWPIPLAHGALGAAGLAVLLLVLRKGLPPSSAGTAGFGPTAAALLALALALGLAIGLSRRRPPGLLVAIHAGLAIAGFVVLWTLVSLG